MARRNRTRRIDPDSFVNSNGYVVVRCGGKFVRQHRAVYEKYYGPIPPGHHVHHKDGRRDNNNPKNLVAVPARDHLSRHAAAQNRLPDGRFAPGRREGSSFLSIRTFCHQLGRSEHEQPEP